MSDKWKRLWKLIGVLFFLIWMALLAQLFWECESKSQWKQLLNPQCKLAKEVPILQLVSAWSFFSTIWLG